MYAKVNLCCRCWRGGSPGKVIEHVWCVTKVTTTEEAI